MGMGFRLDAAKIRTLRIKRGWTQEQLAGIACISPRTVQRAEATGCAAFETVRAVAQAFETDFDQLLESAVGDVHDLGPDAGLRPAPVEAFEQGPVEVGKPATRVRRERMLLPVAAALAAGLVAGVILTPRFDKIEALPSSALHPRSEAPTHNRSRDKLQPDKMTRQAFSVPQTVPEPVPVAGTTQRKVRIAQQQSGHAALRAAEVFGPPYPGFHTVLDSFPLPPSFDLPPKPQELQESLALQLPAEWSDPSILAGNPKSDQADGVLRQAAGQTKNRIGGALAKVQASMRRIF